LNDNGVPFPSLYTTYGFVKPDEEGQFGPVLGNHRKLAKYMELNVSGSGNMAIRVLPNTLDPDHPYTVPGGLNLTTPAQDNRERPLNQPGNRLFLEFSTSGEVEAGYQLSEVKLSLVKEPHSPIRGIA